MEQGLQSCLLWTVERMMAREAKWATDPEDRFELEQRAQRFVALQQVRSLLNDPLRLAPRPLRSKEGGPNTGWATALAAAIVKEAQRSNQAESSALRLGVARRALSAAQDAEGPSSPSGSLEVRISASRARLRQMVAPTPSEAIALLHVDTALLAAAEALQRR
jgi:hypothetical protein